MLPFSLIYWLRRLQVTAKLDFSVPDLSILRPISAMSPPPKPPSDRNPNRSISLSLCGNSIVLFASPFFSWFILIRSLLGGGMGFEHVIVEETEKRRGAGKKMEYLLIKLNSFIFYYFFGG